MIQAGMKFGSKPRSCGLFPLTMELKGISTVSPTPGGIGGAAGGTNAPTGPASGRDVGPGTSGREAGRAGGGSEGRKLAGAGEPNGEEPPGPNIGPPAFPAGDTGALPKGEGIPGGGEDGLGDEANMPPSGTDLGPPAVGPAGGWLKKGEGAGAGGTSANGDAPNAGAGAAGAKGEAPCCGIPKPCISGTSGFGGEMKLDGADAAGGAEKAIANGLSPGGGATSRGPGTGEPGSCKVGAAVKSFCVGMEGGTPSGRRGGRVPIGRLVGALCSGGGIMPIAGGGDCMAAKGDGAGAPPC